MRGQALLTHVSVIRGLEVWALTCRSSHISEHGRRSVHAWRSHSTACDRPNTRGPLIMHITACTVLVTKLHLAGQG